MSDDKLIEAIEHYQRNLNRGLKDDNTAKLLHCIFKLSNLPITVGHLEETGVGRTVNAMRKMDGTVGDASRELVNKWKLMVSQNQDCDDTNKNEPNGKSDSSHRQSDKSKNRSDNSDSDSENTSSDEKSSESENDDEDDEENDSDRYENVKRYKSESPPREKHKNRHHHKKSSKDSKNKSRSSERHLSDSDKRNKDYDRKEKDKYKKDKSPSRSPEKNKYSKEKDRLKSISSSSSSKRKNEEESEKSFSKKHKSHHNKDDDDMKRMKDKSRSESKHKEISQSTSQLLQSKESKKESKRESSDKKSKSKDDKKCLEKVKKESKSNRNANGICSESGTSFADALGMLEPSTSKSTPITNSNKKTKPEKSIREKTPEKSYRKESFEREDKKEKKREKDGESNKHEKSKERDKKNSTSTSSSSSSSTSSKIEVMIPPPPKNDLDINISSLLPTITPNYRPLANPLYDSMQNLGRGKTLNDDEALSLVMSQKNQRTKVYSGNKMFFNSIPTLFELCIRVLQDNIDALEYTGGVPYIILKPVLDKASPQQLYTMEHYNPYLIEDTDELWQFHCSKDFKNKRREELESWRDMYMRCLDEREAKLKALTENIKVAQEKSTPVRQTKLAYIDSFVKPPRDVIRKQAKNGIDKKPFITPQSRLNAIAAGSSASISVPNPVRASSNNSSGSVKPKKAPLMQKTLAFLKGGRFRR